MKTDARHSRGGAQWRESFGGAGDGGDIPSRAGDAPTASLVDVVDACLDLAVEHMLSLQRPNGSWEALPDARIFETALCGYALSHTPGNLDARVVARARGWVAAAIPQSHHPVSHLLEVVLRRIFLGFGGDVDLTASELDAPVMASRGVLLHTLALHAGLEVHGSYSEAELRGRVAREYERGSQAKLKPWSKVELLSLHILLQARAGRVEAVMAAGVELLHALSPTADVVFNPVSAALAYIALCVAAPDSEPRHRLRAHLLQDQQPDGTWRFCSGDIWDTSLILRSFTNHPLFASEGRERALDFLEATQSQDGGWPFRSGVESDNDTTGAVMLALRDTPQGERTVDRALAYLARVQMDSGLWRTWQSSDDPPVKDVVAHVLLGLDAYVDRHHIDTAAARCWLAEQVRPRGAWAASWYRGVPYALAEIGPALGFHHPLVHAGIDALAASQREDGGWGPDLEGPSTASATGLALAVVVRHHPQRADRALHFLVETQRPDGTWPGTPDMYGPRPLLSHFTTHTQAFVVGGMLAARCRGWPRSDVAVHHRADPLRDPP